MKAAALILALLTAAGISADDTSTAIFAPSFKTLKVQIADDFFAPPVLLLGDDRLQLVVSFDEIADDSRYLRYSIEHMTPTWQPSSLLPGEYASGFNEAQVTDFAFSQNTFRHYVNYRIVLPSKELRPLLSGNYLLKVWDEDDPSEILLQARFAESENIGTISASYSNITDRGSDGPYQQVSFTYNPGEFEIRDPFQDIQALVVQNSDPSTAVFVKPLRLQGKPLSMSISRNCSSVPATNGADSKPPAPTIQACI